MSSPTSSLRTIRPGLVSITFRALSAESVIELASANGLDAIEWGGDIHVPHGDLRAAEAVRQMTADAGLEVAAYGSYFRAGDRRGAAVPFAAVLESAAALGAPLIRIWPGVRGSADSDEAERARVAEAISAAAEQAGAEGIRLALEFHGGTLTDTRKSATDLFARIPGSVTSYWQPRVGASADERMADLEAVAARLSHVHVFAWEAGPRGTVRNPLASAADEWRGYLKKIRGLGGERFALLEFVAADDPANLAADARVLRELLENE